jgi:mannose-6-phosphate isomerase-like protein (cupin superfamily)
MAIAIDKPTATKFNLTSQLLSKGRSTDRRATTDHMTIAMKVYAEGGENGMHTHLHEDHSFIVLQGEATFHLDREENAVVARKHEGVMLPAGAQYRFESTGGENLVMIRVGALIAGAPRARLKPDGSPIPGDSADNHHIEPVALPGAFFE